ncbi:MAG: class I SAM-dependent methyltransferase [Myxococcota bacterium]
MTSYGKLCTEFYEIDKPDPLPDALEFYLREAERAEGPILEPMCGSGRYLLPLLERGFDIEGSDTSAHMLAACRARAAKAELAPRLAEQALHQLESPQRYALIFIPSGSFCLITDPAVVRESLRRVYAALAPGGRFIAEIERRDPKKHSELSGTWGGRWVTRPDGAKIIINWLSQYAASTGVVSSVHRYDLVKDGRLVEQEYEDFELKLYDLSEFRELLRSGGFTQIQVVNAYEGSPIDEEALVTEEDAMLFIAQR